MNIGVIGTGNMGINHVRIYSELKSVDSLYVHDLNFSRAKMIATKYNAEVCDSFDDLLKKVDAVSICVPTQIHAKIAKIAIEREINILVEKPLCSTFREAENLTKSLPDSIVAGVGHIERFNPIVEEILRIVKQPLYIEIKRHNPDSARIQGVSVIEDLMIHDIDILFNSFKIEKYFLKCVGNQEMCFALLGCNGLNCYLSASKKSSKKIRMIYIEEDDRTIEGNFMAQEIYVYTKPDKYCMDNSRYIQENIIEKVQVNKVEPLKIELMTYLNCIKNKTQFPISFQQGLQNLRICEEIKKSMMTT